MKRLLLILGLLAVTMPAAAADAPALKFNVLFDVPMADGSKGFGLLLPSAEAGKGTMLVICPTATPPVAWYTVTRSDTPVPTPTPTPTPTPIPPIPVPPTPTAELPLGKYIAFTGPSPTTMEGLTPDQVALVLSADRVAASEKWCDKGPDGKTPQSRLLPRSAGTGLLAEPWLTVLKKTDASKAQLVMVNGTTQKVVDLPANLSGFLELGKTVFGSAADVSLAPTRGPPPPIMSDATIAEMEKSAKAHQHTDASGVIRMLGAMPRDRVRHPVGSIPGSKPLSATGVKVIPRTEWPARVAALAAANAGLKPLTYVLKPYDQASTNYCWANCVTQGCTALNYVQGGPIVYWSAASVGGPITSYRNVGGYPGDAIQYCTSDGAASWDLWPNASISSSYASKAEVKADRLKHKIVMTIADLGETKIQDETATCVLLGAPVAVCYNWWSHAVLVVGLVQDNGTWYFIIRNSWGEYEDHGFFLLPIDGKGRPDDSQAILGVTLSAAERRPANQALAA